MYEETGLLFPYFQCFSPKPNTGTNIFQTSTISEYDLGGEGDLFKAPEPIIEEPELGLDPMTAAMSMISSCEDVMPVQTVTDIESIENEHLLNEVIYECKKDLLAKSAMEEAISLPSDVQVPALPIEEALSKEKDQLISGVTLQKSVSSGSLSSMDWINRGCIMRPSFLEFQTMDLGAAFGMRRAYSEGDIQTLSSVNASIIHSPFERMLTIGNYTIEERRQRLSRYRKKKSKRNFSRKIKYACRKALADSQPRVRGRFARTEEAEVSSLLKQNVL